MLQFLTDEQISPDVAVAARRLCRGVPITTMFEWLAGHFVSAPDEEVLREAARRKLTLVSFDLRTIPPLLRAWGEQGIDHGGVIFVDEKSIPQNKIGVLARALCALWKLQGQADWTNRCFFLQRPRN
jgi:hypothetical protein